MPILAIAAVVGIFSTVGACVLALWRLILWVAGHVSTGEWCDDARMKAAVQRGQQEWARLVAEGVDFRSILFIATQDGAVQVWRGGKIYCEGRPEDVYGFFAAQWWPCVNIQGVRVSEAA